MPHYLAVYRAVGTGGHADPDISTREDFNPGQITGAGCTGADYRAVVSRGAKGEFC